ncbi:hypothetical protein L3X38_038226 [Prunus dulcis]|uniref:Uncharacterized protein n=1 Tax=Prunus dulcis TaxID=3755 RepID=A0AAD4YRZ8_PRUDU|nr:hypothetical protein L3X38_038226 [Prunus dulcis]
MIRACPLLRQTWAKGPPGSPFQLQRATMSQGKWWVPPVWASPQANPACVVALGLLTSVADFEMVTSHVASPGASDQKILHNRIVQFLA